MDRRQLNDTILAALRTVVPRVDPARLDPAVNFRDQVELDSVDYLGFVLELEKRLAIRVPQSDYPRLSSLDGCLAYLASACAVDH